MTFTEISELISNGAITGPQVGVCNCINSLATASRERAGNLEGLIGEARDIDNITQRVYFNSLDPNFLVILGIASVMGIQLHNNLRTENPELWSELNTLINSKYFKTFIALPEDLAVTILGDITTATEGAPAILTSTGELYVSGDLMEAVFQSLHNAGAFDTGSTDFTRPELFTASTTLTQEQFLTNYGTSWPIIEAYFNSIWGDLKTAIANNRLWNASADKVAAINYFNDFTSYWAKYKELRPTEAEETERDTNFYWISTEELYESGNPTTKIDLTRLFTFDKLQTYSINLILNEYETLKVYRINDRSDTPFKKMTRYLELNNGEFTAYSRNFSAYEEARDRLEHHDYFIPYGFGPVSMSSTPAAPEGITQEEGATIPNPNDNSFTNWAAANLTTYDNTKLITNALATQNIGAHSQNWYKIVIPYRFGYDLQLDGAEEEPEGGAVTQNHELLTSQQEESTEAGLTDTGTNTNTIINVYNAENGSEPLNDNQKDNGDVELEDLPPDDWKAAGCTGIYCPNSSQIEQIENWLWNIYPSSASEFFQNPMEAFIALYKTYFPHTPAGSQEVVFGYVGSGVNSPVTNRYHEYSLGQIHVGKTFNNYMDYSGNASIYVPFCGFQSVDLKDIMDADIELIYRVEFLTGAGVAILMVERDEMSAPLYVWPVNVFESIPFSSYNALGTLTAGIGAISNTVSGAIGGAVTGGVLGALGGAIGSAIGSVGSLAQSSHVQQGGSLSGNGAMQGPKTGYLTIRYNKNSTPEAYKEFEGVGTDTVSTIGSFNGYVKFRDVKLTGIIGASNEVLEDIESALKEGVYI